MSDLDTTPMHDPQLIILRELEAEFERELALIGQAGPRVRCWDRVSVRIGRRALVLVALICLIGGSALAGRSVLDGSHTTSSSPLLLASGGHGPEAWQLEAYVYRGATCYVLFAGETATSSCQAAPGEGAAESLSALSPSTRLVAGLAGAKVAKVLIEVGKNKTLVTTHAQVDRPMDAGLAPGSRWFVALFPGGASAAGVPPAALIPRARDGRRLGPTVLDCSLGAASPACRQAAEHIVTSSTQAAS